MSPVAFHHKMSWLLSAFLTQQRCQMLLQLLTYGEDSIDTLMNHGGVEKAATTVQGDFMKSSKYPQRYAENGKNLPSLTLPKNTQDNMTTQLKDWESHEMLATVFPNLNTLSNICLMIPVSTASVERSFLHMIKNKVKKSHWYQCPLPLLREAFCT